MSSDYLCYQGDATENDKKWFFVNKQEVFLAVMLSLIMRSLLEVVILIRWIGGK